MFMNWICMKKLKPIKRLTNICLVVFKDIHKLVIIVSHGFFMHPAHDELPAVEHKKGVVLLFFGRVYLNQFIQWFLKHVDRVGLIDFPFQHIHI